MISTVTVNVLKFQTLSPSVLKRNPCQNSKQGRPRSDCFIRSSLIWFFTVCLDLFCSQQLTFDITMFLQPKLKKFKHLEKYLFLVCELFLDLFYNMSAFMKFKIGTVGDKCFYM